MWIDAAGGGRFTVVTAETGAHAAWKVAIEQDSSAAMFEDIETLPEGS